MGKYLSSCHSLLRSFGGDASMCTILTNDIQQMARLLNQVSAQRLPAQRAIINALRTSLSKLWPTARAEVYGSLATGLCTPSSDVDIVICDTEHVPKDIQKAQESRVQRLSKHLSREKWIRTVNTIGSASMPIVKVIAMAGATEVQLDLSFDSSLHRGLPTCAYVRGLCIEYPELVPLSLVLKQFLVSKKINNPYSGGLSSYGLILMLASIVKRDYIFQQFTSSSLLGTKETKSETTPRQSSPQNRSAPDVDTKGNEENECDATIGDLVPYIKTGLFSDKANLGRLLLTFFDTYGRRFDPELHALSVSNSEDVPDFAFCGAKYRHWFPNHTVVIIDPFNPNNNIGRTCFNFWQIQQVFSTALNCAIDRFVSIPIRRLRQSVLGAVFSTSHHKIVVDTERKRNLPRAFTPSPPRAKAGSRGTRAASLHLHEDGDAIHTEPLQSVDDNLVECRLTMQRKKAVLVANIEELNKQIKKRKLMNELLIVKAEQRSKTVGQLAKNGDVDNLMSHVQELTSYLAWLNEQKRANHKEIEHLKTKIQSLKQDFHADMKALASGVGKAPFTIEQLQVVFQGESKARLKRSGRRERKRVDAIVDRTTCIASWRIAQLKEDIEEMEQMNDQLEACAQYQAAKLAMQKLKARAGGDADGAVKLASEAPLNMIKLLNSRTSSRASTEGAARSDSKRGTTRQASRCNDVNIERKECKTTHALEWCPDATVTGGADEQEVRRTSTYLAWLNEQNRVNQMQIKHLKAKVDREKQQYICEIARLTIEAVTMTPTLSQASSPQETPKGGSFGRG